MNTSKSLSYGDLSFKYTKKSGPKLGLIVSKKYGTAVQRNLFKRRCRSLFRSIMVNNNIGYALIIRPKRSAVSFRAIQISFNSMYDKLSN